MIAVTLTLSTVAFILVCVALSHFINYWQCTRRHVQAEDKLAADIKQMADDIKSIVHGINHPTAQEIWDNHNDA